MKAIVMAGGEGTRLRPVTGGIPKPMVELLGRPILSYTVELLRKNGIEDICFTLKYLPRIIQDYFGDGSEFGVRINSRVEDTPLGTAGGVRACGDFTAGEDVLIMSGDAVCDFDLKRCIEFHREHKADATLVLYEHPEPTEYGLVVTDREGRVEKFLEKPRWDMVLTDLVNTGIYILSPKALELIPEGCQYDFGKDLFPKMLKEGMSMWGVCPEGYWCDVGSPEAYRRCCIDVAAGKTKLPIHGKEVSPGIWAEGEISKGVDITPPSYIGEGCTIASGAKIGPGAVLTGGSSVMEGACIRESVVNGANIEERAVIVGAIIGKGALIGREARINEGCVIGDRASVGDGGVVSPGVKVWTGRSVTPGSALRENLVGELARERPSIGGGRARGEYLTGMTPELLMAYGGILGAQGRTGAAWCGGEAARLLADAFGCGATGAGAEFYQIDCGFEAELASMARQFGIDGAVFIRQERGRITLSFFGADGLKLRPELQRKLETAGTGEYPRTNSSAVGGVYKMTGSERAYISDILRMLTERGIKLPLTGTYASVKGTGAENRTLRRVLEAMGVSISDVRGPVFTICQGGENFTIAGGVLGDIAAEKSAVIAAAAAMELGERSVAIPFDAAAAAEEMAAARGIVLLRQGRDQGAEKLMGSQRFMLDGILAVSLIMGTMHERDTTLEQLAGMVPEFVTQERVVDVAFSRARAMRMLSETKSEMSSEFGRGLGIDTSRGRARVSPSADGRAIIIRGEAKDQETAEELCGDIEKLVEGLKGRNRDEK